MLPKLTPVFPAGIFPMGIYIMMGLPEELYGEMLEVGHTASRHNIPDPLPELVGVAGRLLEVWRSDERTMVLFASMALAGPTNLRVTTGLLPEPVAEACWRLIRLLEYIARPRQKTPSQLSRAAGWTRKCIGRGRLWTRKCIGR